MVIVAKIDSLRRFLENKKDKKVNNNIDMYKYNGTKSKK